LPHDIEANVAILQSTDSIGQRPEVIDQHIERAHCLALLTRFKTLEADLMRFVLLAYLPECLDPYLRSPGLGE
jgi:hypothetical protein